MPTVYPFRFSNLTRLGCGLVGSNLVRTYLPSSRISTSKRSPGLAWRRVTRCLLSAMAVIEGGTSHQKPPKARLLSPLLPLLSEPDFTRLATGDLKSGSAPQPERPARRLNWWLPAREAGLRSS